MIGPSDLRQRHPVMLPIAAIPAQPFSNQPRNRLPDFPRCPVNTKPGVDGMRPGFVIKMSWVTDAYNVMTAFKSFSSPELEQPAPEKPGGGIRIVLIQKDY